ncbi:MAG: type II and III secretion system protein family protein [Acetobacter sp.]|nr:type II and III secretion system protein family protein [Acetobacter sp.]
MKRTPRWKFLLFAFVFMPLPVLASVHSFAEEQPSQINPQHQQEREIQTVRINHAIHERYSGKHHQKHLEHGQHVSHVSHSSFSALQEALSPANHAVHHAKAKSKVKHLAKKTTLHKHSAHNHSAVHEVGRIRIENDSSYNATTPVGAIQPTAQSVENTNSPSSTLEVQMGRGHTVTLTDTIARLFVGDPKVVKVRSVGQKGFFVFGLHPGVTIIEALSSTGKVLARYTTTVTPSEYHASFLKSGVAAQSPHVTLKPLPGNGIALDGEAPNPEAAQKLIERTQEIVGSNGYVSDYMKVPMSIQVNLQVRIVEMDRKLVRDFGLDWQNVVQLGNAVLVGLVSAHTMASAMISVPNSGGDINKLFEALASDGLVRNLAQPNLTTISGQPASFLVGGEFPVPISNYTGTPMISFKPYGVSLSFVPTVLANGQISLHVRPSVSQLNYQNSVSVTSMNTKSTLEIPGISMRSADTTVELGSGQSFAIAGLLEDVAQMNTSGMPWLKNIPILGALFKSSSFQDQETELVIIVTPYLVKPVNNIRQLHTPDQTWRWPQGVDQVFLMHQSQTNTSKRPPWQKVDANNVGFIME